MKDLVKQYENAKQVAKTYMSQGLITEYFNALMRVNEYEKLLVAVVAN